MKFCGKCGRELNENAAFCTVCGAKVETAAIKPSYIGTQPNTDVRGSTTAMLQSMKQAGTGGLAQLGENMKLFVVTACLLVLSLIFMFIPILYQSVTVFVRQTDSASISYLLSEAGAGFFTVVGILLAITAAIFLFLPLLTNSRHTTRNFIFTKIWSIYSLCLGSFLMMIFIIAGAQGTQIWGQQGVEVRFGLTFGGYMFLLINIALIVAAFKLSSKFKMNRESKLH